MAMAHETCIFGGRGCISVKLVSQLDPFLTPHARRRIPGAEAEAEAGGTYSTVRLVT